MKKYYITGVPGVGKTTTMKELQKRGFAAFDLDHVPGLCRWINRTSKDPVEFIMGASKEWHEAHTWVCDVEKLKELLAHETAEHLFVCGLTNNQEEYYSLFNNVVLLHANSRIFLDRMAGRDDQHFGFHEDDRKSVLDWYELFEKETIEGGALAIDSTQDVKDTVNEILKALHLNEAHT